jgi:hypothetical protein
MRYTLNLPLRLGKKHRWEIGSLGEILDARNNKMIDRTPPKVVQNEDARFSVDLLKISLPDLTILYFESNRHVCRYALVFCKP